MSTAATFRGAGGAAGGGEGAGLLISWLSSRSLLAVSKVLSVLVSECC
ncbi:MAG: hypothetical protein IPQ09_25250 [Myxococcales bacterium]|nr:hypothetical protein [Myxococcales bacterium]MBL0197472.1 hypothetical protein [Myxococcales bacterium]